MYLLWCNIYLHLQIDDGIQPSARNNPGTSSQGCLQRALSQHQSSEAHLQSEVSCILFISSSVDG